MFHQSYIQLLCFGSSRRASNRFCRVWPRPPSFRNAATAFSDAAYSSLLRRGCIDLRYRAEVSSREGTGRRGSESSNRNMAPFDMSSRYPSGTQYCCFEAFLFVAGAMRTIFGFCINLGTRPSLETAVWLVLPSAANIPDAALGERKDERLLQD